MLCIRDFGVKEYGEVFSKMRQFTQERDAQSKDEFWCLQHFPVFTLGANANQQHILKHTDIPVVQSDRGGQVTYHGPGQLVVYMMIDLKRKSMGVKHLVEKIEQSVVSLLKSYNIDSVARADAHGVYVENAKIASLGLRVHQGCSYHGLALNVDMDLSPFTMINPCGYEGLEVTQMADHIELEDTNEITLQLIENLVCNLNYQSDQIRTYKESDTIEK